MVKTKKQIRKMTLLSTEHVMSLETNKTYILATTHKHMHKYIHISIKTHIGIYRAYKHTHTQTSIHPHAHRNIHVQTVLIMVD